MASYNYTLAQEILALIDAAFPSENTAVEFVPEFDKGLGSDRLTRVFPFLDDTGDDDGDRGSEAHTVVIAIAIWKPLADSAPATVADQLEYVEQVSALTRRVQTTIDGTLWGWQKTESVPLYAVESLRVDTEFLSWIGVTFSGNI